MKRDQMEKFLNRFAQHQAGTGLQDCYEDRILLDYCHNVLHDKRVTPRTFAEVCDWIHNQSTALGIDLTDENLAEDLDTLNRVDIDPTLYRKAVRIVHTWVIPYVRQRREDLRSAKPGLFQKNLNLLGKELALDKTDVKILGLLARYFSHSTVEELCDALCRKNGRALTAVAILLNLDEDLVADRLGPKGTLLSTGLVKPKSGRVSLLSDLVEVNEAVISALQKARGKRDDLRSLILGVPCKAQLDWEDFDYLGEVREKLQQFLANAYRSKEVGINILLYGAPGTGKTEFCKILAQELGLNLYAIGEKDEDGLAPTRTERMAAYRVAQSLLRNQSGSLLMFDEFDDLLSAPLSRGHHQAHADSKIYFNRILEANPVPSVWIINTLEGIDPSIIRRMSVAFEFREPPKANREKVLRRILVRHGLDLDQEQIDGLLREGGIAPALIDSAVRFAKLTGGSKDDIDFALHNLLQALHGRPQRKKETPKSLDRYQPALINADLDLRRLTRRLTSRQMTRAFSLCLYGPPGTGKSAYARHLAEKLGLEILIKRASDIISPFVGQTEMNIARMFEQARNEGSLLVLDEADSFLIDRRQAHYRWEVSEVNEMLTWMEQHPLPFVCTTNLMDRLDQASLRRFTFKVQFDFLTQEQVVLAFRHFFGRRWPKDLPVPTLLTPGDFAVVARKAQIMKMTRAAELIAMLNQERQMKQATSSRPLGFTVSG